MVTVRMTAAAAGGAHVFVLATSAVMTGPTVELEAQFLPRRPDGTATVGVAPVVVFFCCGAGFGPRSQCPGVGRRFPRGSLAWPAVVCTPRQRGARTATCSAPPALSPFWCIATKFLPLSSSICPIILLLAVIHMDGDTLSTSGLGWSFSVPRPPVQPLPQQTGMTTRSRRSGGTNLQGVDVPVPLPPRR